MQSLERAFRVVGAIDDRGTAGVTELSEALALPKSTTHRYLTELERHGYVVRSGTDYRLSLRFLDYGTRVRDGYEHASLFRSKTRELAELTSERVQFVVEEHGLGVHLYTERGEHAIAADVRAGKRVPLHATASGKALLAFLPAETVEAVLDREGLPELTDATVTDRAELLAELEETRQTRVAFNRAERIDGLYSVGVPVRHDGGVLGAFSVTGARRRMAGERIETEIPETLLEFAEEIELRLTYDE